MATKHAMPKELPEGVFSLTVHPAGSIDEARAEKCLSKVEAHIAMGGAVLSVCDIDGTAIDFMKSGFAKKTVLNFDVVAFQEAMSRLGARVEVLTSRYYDEDFSNRWCERSVNTVREILRKKLGGEHLTLDLKTVHCSERSGYRCSKFQRAADVLIGPMYEFGKNRPLMVVLCDDQDGELESANPVYRSYAEKGLKIAFRGVKSSEYSCVNPGEFSVLAKACPIRATVTSTAGVRITGKLPPRSPLTRPAEPGSSGLERKEGGADDARPVSPSRLAV